MRKTIIFIYLLFVSVPAYSACYIVDKDNRVMSKVGYLPNKSDIESRNEIFVCSDKDIPLDQAEYRGGKVVKHVETKAEKKAKKAKDDARKLKVERRKSAKTKLKALGLTDEEIDALIN